MTQSEMNETVAQASLDRLHDIIVPDAIGFFPPAPGWYIVVSLLAAWLFHVAVVRYKAYRESAYRRDALAELASIGATGEESALALLLLAKRVAIAAYGRQKTAGLSNEAWWDFVEAHSKVKVDDALRRSTAQLLYGEQTEITDGELKAIRDIVQKWIKTHRRGEDV